MNAEIMIIGVNHWDPLGRYRIESILNRLQVEYSYIPDCIAVEWGEQNYRRVASKRSEFRILAKNHLSFLSTNQLECLSLSLAYEADSHIPFYPDLPIIWLDEKRNGEGEDSTIATYAPDRLRIINSYLTRYDYSNENVLSVISEAAWANSDSSPPNPLNRDLIFFQKTESAIKIGFHKIIAVVGATHANLSCKGVFANLLKENGYRVRVFLTDHDI